LVATRGGKTTSYELARSVFNLSTAKGWCEVTFFAEAKCPSNADASPRLEVTVIFETAPTIEAGASWQRCPAYVDKEALWNLSYYFGWEFENLASYDIEIKSTDGRSVSAEISCPFHEYPDDRVIVKGHFLRDENLKRSVW
jgi:hypothetical protein